MNMNGISSSGSSYTHPHTPFQRRRKTSDQMCCTKCSFLNSVFSFLLTLFFFPTFLPSSLPPFLLPLLSLQRPTVAQSAGTQSPGPVRRRSVSAGCNVLRGVSPCPLCPPGAVGPSVTELLLCFRAARTVFIAGEAAEMLLLH